MWQASAILAFLWRDEKGEYHQIHGSDNLHVQLRENRRGPVSSEKLEGKTPEFATYIPTPLHTHIQRERKSKSELYPVSKNFWLFCIKIV